MRASASTTPIYTDIKGAAGRIKVSDFTIRDLIARGELPAYRFSDKPGSAIRVKIADVDALMKPVIPAEINAAR
ncbi:excisionase family DNA-binding protein [Mycobacterium sp. ENV421]|uniref:excisionase family DNA-binding protein n=1 Tax=Mycobacterium sp. ENV421 TaxID=1213407 RepID=UPI001E4641C2|nr:excisionase family DNA-binding protein [Mycobacterium sp. ENV421]